MDGSFAFLFAFFAVWGPGSLWLICLSVMPLVIIIAILVHLSHTFGSRLERRITQRLDRRELERRPTL
jgi:hypothetical protein